MASLMENSRMESMYVEGDYLANNPAWHVEDSPSKARWIDAILR